MAEDDAKALLEAAGYVVLRERSYRAAQERQRIAEARKDWAEERAEHCRQWALDCLAAERQGRDRVTFLYGVARAHGATVEELGGSLAPKYSDSATWLEPLAQTTGVSS